MTKRKTVDTCANCGKTYPHVRAHEIYCSLDCATSIKLSPPNGDGCMIWTGAKNKAGYGQITRNRVRYYVHRVRYELATGAPIPDGMNACHTCDVRACCNPAHIFIGTQAENLSDMREKGRGTKGRRQLRNFGENHAQSKLTLATAKEIAAIYAAGGVSQYELAELYGVSQTVIWRIAKGRHWSSGA